MANRVAIKSLSAGEAAAAGVLSLAVAMGIGRFAFTPMLPLMIRGGELDAAAGGWLAAANYLGYLVGALSASRFPCSPRTLVVGALVAIAALTAAMALPGPMALWLALRFAAGAASAWAFVGTSVWCLAALAERGRAGWGSVVYSGVGAGIALTGAYCLWGAARASTAAALWWQLGALALALTLTIQIALGRGPVTTAAPAASRTESATRSPAPATRGLVACYGVMGFGYILPATFLPLMARSVVDDPRVFGLAWPVFGATAAVSTLLAAWWLRGTSRLRVWAVSQIAMGVGVLLPSLWLSGWTIAASALLVGGTFMVITLAGVQEIRTLDPTRSTALVGRMTAAFALGQIAGPVLASLLLQRPGLRDQGLALSLQASALALVASAAWLFRRARS
jgi:hypothetical protein